MTINIQDVSLSLQQTYFRGKSKMSEEQGAETSIPKADLLRMATEVVSSYVSNNTVGPDQLPELINSVHSTLMSVDGSRSSAPDLPLKPAVPIRRSVQPDFIVCLEDGKKLKMLKRHLRTTYDMTPDEYRAKWNLRTNYPMVAPDYAKRRSEMAKKIGLGTRSTRGKRK